MFRAVLRRIAGKLAGAGLPYMLIGGQAVLFYGEPRLTKDIDVALGVGIDELPRVLDVVRRIGLEPLPEDPAGFARRTMVLPAAESKSGIRVDFIFSFLPYERQAIERARYVLIGKTALRMATLEDVIIHKIVAGRARDLEDVGSVIRKNPEFDGAYVERWLREFENATGGDFRKTLAGIVADAPG